MNTSPAEKKVAVLGAGIMGSCLALFLARKGVSVSLFDMDAVPMNGASRWNEGKIHLGYLYAADPQLLTARHLLPGGLAFAPLMQELLQQPLEACTSHGDDIFFIHRDSVIGPDQARHYYQSVSDLVRNTAGAGHYPGDARHARSEELSPAELGSLVDPGLVKAGFRIPERSVQTNWIADRICAALKSEPLITQRMNTRITAARATGAADQPWLVASGDSEEPFDYVINALWQGRIDIDRSAGMEPEAEWSNRYRLSLFARASRLVDFPCAVLAVGPFGDIKNYNGRDFYLSWYPAGLLHESENTCTELAAGEPSFDAAKIIASTRAGLSSAFHGIGAILDQCEDIRVAGGWVFAQGRGSLSNPASSLHRRDRFGIRRNGRYYSIDTGKYSIAPWLAQRVAGEIAAS